MSKPEAPAKSSTPAGKAGDTSASSAADTATSATTQKVKTRKKATDPSGHSWLRRRFIDGNGVHKILIVMLALGCAGLYGWQVWQAYEAEQARDGELATMRAALQSEFDGKAASSLRLTGSALGWAAATDLARDNLAAIDRELTRLVKEEGVTRLAVIDGNGVVRVCTNKKLEGQTATEAFPGVAFDVDEIATVSADDERLLVVPLMYDNARVGTAVLAMSR